MAGNMSSDMLMRALVGKGLLAKMGQAGQEQRALIDELAVDILINHHNEDDGSEPQRKSWPTCYDGKPVVPLVKV